MKKAIVLFLTLIFILSSLTATYADDVTEPADDPIIEDYIDISRITASLDISGNTASCYGSARSRVDTDSIHMWMYLQKQTSTGWTMVTSWYKQNTRLVSLDKTKSGLSAGTYRVRLYIKVYDSNGNFVEYANAYSKLKVVS